MRTMLHLTSAPSASTSSSNHLYTHTGIGGAGNVRRIAPPTTITEPLAQPLSTTSTNTSESNAATATGGSPPLSNLHRPRGFSTGRGGAGNMSRAGSYLAMFAFDEENVELQQRIHSSRPAPVTYHTGRGGGGNAVYPGYPAGAHPSPVVAPVGVRRSVSAQSDDSLHLSNNAEERVPRSRTRGLDGESGRKRSLDIAKEWLRRW
ncbi:hypothetical protein MMC07_001357 [Pseudocyphellaria aurata]|nr:hypothetical protein [Pseudocyphellaria aurata]